MIDIPICMYLTWWIHLCYIFALRLCQKAVFRVCVGFLSSPASSFQLWSSILEVKPQQLVENFEQNYGSFLEGGFFHRVGRFGRVGSQRGRLPWFFLNIKVLVCLVVKLLKLLMHGLPGWWVRVSNLAARKLLDEFDPRSFWQVNSGSRKNRQNHQGRRLIADSLFFCFFLAPGPIWRRKTTNIGLQFTGICEMMVAGKGY